MKKIAITGGISSGKSTVCELLAKQSSYIVNADSIVHNLLKSDSNVRRQVIDLLGPSVVINGQISREAVAKKVFSDPETLKSLEHILHPAVFHDIEANYQTIKNNPNYDLFVAEIPLLYETDSAHLFDFVVVVLADEALCQKRFKQRQQEKDSTFSQRMLRQMDPQQKAAKAHFVLLNNGNLEDLEKQVTNLLTKLRSN